MRTAVVLLVFLSFIALGDPIVETVAAYAYPTPWACGDGALTFRLETSWELASPPVFVVVDLAGQEVVRLQGELAPWKKDEYWEFIYEAAWDGRNADGRPVAPGTYIAYVEGVADTAFRFIVTR